MCRLFGEVFMGKSSQRIFASFVLLAASCGAARAQAVTEYGGAASRSATTAAGSQHVSKSIGSVWSSLDKTLKGSPKHSGSKRASARQAGGASKGSHASAAVLQDPSRIQPGISYEELVRRCGPPSFQVTDSSDTKRITYLRRNDSVDLEVRDGKVVKVGTANSQEIAVAAPK
jgi:hypothetical protein